MMQNWIVTMSKCEDCNNEFWCRKLLSYFHRQKDGSLVCYEFEKKEGEVK